MPKLTCYRGHIRNWEALAEELGLDLTSLRAELLPEDFRAKREEEILLAAYEKWGYEMGSHLHGMFALAIEDGDKVYALRDQFGTKPFYYYVTEDYRLLYGTYIRDILVQDGFEKRLNERMLQLYLSLTYVAGEETFFEGILKLMPGQYLVFEDKELSIVDYWTPDFHPDYLPGEEHAEDAAPAKALEEYADDIHTTMLQMMKEVKTDDETVESFLSGGVDSSYVFALSDAEAADTCGYDEPKFDESPLAAETAKTLGRKINRLRVTPEDYFKVIPDVMRDMEQPLGDASAIVFTLGCRSTAEHTKICYSGEGSDEMFGGYNMYRNAPRYGENLPTFYVGNTNIMKEDMKEKILKNYDPENLPINLATPIYDEIEDYKPLEKMQEVDIRLWLEGDIYLNVDKMSTASGLEIRMPITDTRIFDIAARLPEEYKVSETENKVAFRTAAAKVLPEEVAFRKKLGFIVPVRFWLADPQYNGDVVRLFHSDIAEKFFKVDEINAIYDEYIGGNSDLWRQVYTIYSFLVWYEIYFVKNEMRAE